MIAAPRLSGAPTVGAWRFPTTSKPLEAKMTREGEGMLNMERFYVLTKRGEDAKMITLLPRTKRIDR